MPPTVPLGRFVWYELSTPDSEAAREFYTQLFGWRVRVHEGLEEPYPMFAVDEVPIAGIVAMPVAELKEGGIPGWLGYVTTPNVEGTVARALELGATQLVGPRDIGEFGRTAVVADPRGASLALYRPNRPPEPTAEPSPGFVSWHELATTSHEAASAYYAELFGWNIGEDHDMGDLGTYRIFGDGERRLGGMYDKPSKTTAAWLYYVRVQDLDGALALVVGGGGEVVEGPMDGLGGSRVALCEDPQGARFGMEEK